MTSLQHRIFEPEHMDMPDADVPKLLRTVRQFALINRLFSRSQTLLTQHVVAPNRKTGRDISIIDVGAGGGDIMRALVRKCRTEGIACRVTLLDNDRRILRQTEQACRSFPEIHIQEGSIDDLPRLGSFDYVFSNHLLHHFSNADIPAVLKKMYDASSRMMIVNDLHRTVSAYGAYAIFSGIFLHRSFAAFDGLLSIRKGFRTDELAQYAASAGIGPQAKIKQHLPARISLVAAKPSPGSAFKEETKI